MIIEHSDERRTLRLHNEPMISKLAIQFRILDAADVHIPLRGHLFKESTGDDANDLHLPYRELILWLMHLSNTVQPDIAFSLGNLCGSCNATLINIGTLRKTFWSTWILQNTQLYRIIWIRLDDYLALQMLNFQVIRLTEILRVDVFLATPEDQYRGTASSNIRSAIKARSRVCSYVIWSLRGSMATKIKERTVKEARSVRYCSMAPTNE